MRGHLVQLANIWVYCALLAGVVAAGGTHFARTWFALDDAQMGRVLTVFAVGLLLLAALALVPRRRVYLATNVLVAAFSAFLAVQLVHVSVPATEPVALGAPLTGEWLVLNGGHAPCSTVTPRTRATPWTSSGLARTGERTPAATTLS